MFGFLNVYKPIGLTSHDVVARFRKLIKIKQIGHTGTLDPFAEGVLPVCIGKATRLIEYLQDDKAYLAFVKFGTATETYDVEGKVTFSSEKSICEEQVIVALKKYNGEILQMPPKYSAIKVKGKKLYEYAREGKDVEIQPRKVFIDKIELKSFSPETQIAEIYIECSKGTYIRSIANDLGQDLSVGGHLTRLVRVKAGDFLLDEALNLDDFVDINVVNNNILNPLNFLKFQKKELTENELEKIICGKSIKNDEFKHDDLIILVYNNSVSAIAKVKHNEIYVNKVFNYD